MASTSGGQNSRGHGGRRNKSDRKKVFNPGSGMFRNGGSREEEFGSKKISTSRAGYKANLKPRTVQQITASSR